MLHNISLLAKAWRETYLEWIRRVVWCIGVEAQAQLNLPARQTWCHCSFRSRLHWGDSQSETCHFFIKEPGIMWVTLNMLTIRHLDKWGKRLLPTCLSGCVPLLYLYIFVVRSSVSKTWTSFNWNTALFYFKSNICFEICLIQTFDQRSKVIIMKKTEVWEKGFIIKEYMQVLKNCKWIRTCIGSDQCWSCQLYIWS